MLYKYNSKNVFHVPLWFCTSSFKTTHKIGWITYWNSRAFRRFKSYFHRKTENFFETRSQLHSVKSFSESESDFRNHFLPGRFINLVWTPYDEWWNFFPYCSSPPSLFFTLTRAFFSSFLILQYHFLFLLHS